MDVSVLEQEIAQSARALGQYLEMQLDVDRMVDPLEKLLGDDGEVWDLINGGGVSEEDCSPYGSERQLSQVRKVCRAFASEHPFAICGHENRISYVIGEGHVYTVVAKQGEELSTDAIQGGKGDAAKAPVKAGME